MPSQIPVACIKQVQQLESALRRQAEALDDSTAQATQQESEIQRLRAAGAAAEAAQEQAEKQAEAAAAAVEVQRAETTGLSDQLRDADTALAAARAGLLAASEAAFGALTASADTMESVPPAPALPAAPDALLSLQVRLCCASEVRTDPWCASAVLRPELPHNECQSSRAGMLDLEQGDIPSLLLLCSIVRQLHFGPALRTGYGKQRKPPCSPCSGRSVPHLTRRHCRRCRRTHRS